MDPRTPVLVGAGQLTDREGALTPLALMREAARRAAADAGPGGDALLAKAQSVAAVDLFSWPIPDPAGELARELGLSPRETVVSARGGNGPIALLGDAAAAIARGDLDVALLAGGEAGTQFQAALREGRDAGFGGADAPPSRVVGKDQDPHDPAELDAGLIAPIFWYPMFENALRGAASRTRAEHEAFLGELWLGFADVARDNPFAWTPSPPASAQEIATPSKGNRRVSDPYTKAMNANITVDQGAALLVCSVAAAEAAGIARERWVFVEATAGATDHWFCGTRERWDRSPAIAATTGAVLDGTSVDDVAHLDLYSCFPSAVQVAAKELGIDPLSRPLTVTGGLAFFGGPANDYVMHSLVALVERVRSDGERALATAVGWYLTKHGAALLSGTPGKPFAHHDVQAQVDALPRREIAREAVTGTIESHTAIFDRDGTATMGIAAVRTEDGRRAFGRTFEPDAIAELQAEEPLGRAASTDGAAGFTLA